MSIVCQYVIEQCCSISYAVALFSHFRFLYMESTTPEIRVCSISAYASLGSRLNLSALSVMMKELYRIDNRFDNTRVRTKHDSIEALLCSKTFFNSVSFPMIFTTDDRVHNLHFRVFTTGTIHVAGASDFDVTVKRAFMMVCGIVAACHSYNPCSGIVQNETDFGLRDIRIAMMHTIYEHSSQLDCFNVSVALRNAGYNVRYDPMLHNAVNVRFKNDDGTFLIFRSGKILITGCKRLETCKNELESMLCYT